MQIQANDCQGVPQRSRARHEDLAEQPVVHFGHVGKNINTVHTLADLRGALHQCTPRSIADPSAANVIPTTAGKGLLDPTAAPARTDTPPKAIGRIVENNAPMASRQFGK